MRAPPSISLAPGAENNAFATMLADLVRQNLESKPHKTKDFDALARGRGATIARGGAHAEGARPRQFRDGRLVLHDGIKGVPDVAVRGTADQIMALSNVPLTRPLALPIPTDRTALDVLVEMVRATRSGELKVLGMFGNFRVLSRLTKVMSVNG
jgi:hypothetical protein